MSNYIVREVKDGVPIKAWVNGVPCEDGAWVQLERLAQLPFIYKHIAVMPDCHVGQGSTIGSVIPTQRAIIVASLGVDIGCGVLAARTNLKRGDLKDLPALRKKIENKVPHGRTDNGGPGDRGAWHNIPEYIMNEWECGTFYLEEAFRVVIEDRPNLIGRNQNTHLSQLGTLGTGNHFLEISIDENEDVWIVLHSGSRGIGNRIGSIYLNLAKELMEQFFIKLPDTNLSYIPMEHDYYHEFLNAVKWAQNYAKTNRSLILEGTRRVLEGTNKGFELEEVIDCHHNYVEWENHFGKNILVTRKGAVRARKDDKVIIPGSMGTSTFICIGKGNKDSFESCSHGAGRSMSRTEARNTFNIKMHEEATAGIECRKDKEVIDETPAAYKDINKVMKAQEDLVEVIHTLKQVICIKG